MVYGLRIIGISDRQHLDEVVESTLKRAALWDEVKDTLHKSAAELSGGQQQRLCIARALAVEPEVLLMDEPCSALDPISTAKIEELIHELKDAFTIVIVTHNMQQAARVSDRTAFFYLGEIIEYGETGKLFTNPDKRQTEDYITGRFGLAEEPMQTAHTDKRYGEELKKLREEILYMGGLVEDQIQKAVKSLVDRDSNLAEVIIERDHEVNRLDVDIDELCIRLLALHQPAGRDLRFITTGLKNHHRLGADRRHGG